jgi:hypothetical protein
VDNRGGWNLATVASLAYFKITSEYLNERSQGFRGTRRTRAESIGYRLDSTNMFKRGRIPSAGTGAVVSDEGQVVQDHRPELYIPSSLQGGQVDRWEIIDTTVGIKNDPYPFGWKHADGPNNHNNYDVAKVFRYGWPHMSAEQRRRAASVIADMLHWTLTSSLQMNGSFKTVPTFFSSVGADFYFGVSFLQTIGYWDPAKRFWTEQDFPEAAATCKRIKTRLVEMALKSHESKSALTHLENSC